MSNTAKFDPYLSWLGIRDPERPPNHYRLLGLEQFESDSNVIASAADRQMGHVRTHQAGLHSEDSQRLLNELMSAKICLLKSERKAEYDKVLRGKIAAKNNAANGSNQENLSPFAPNKSTLNGNATAQTSELNDASQFFGAASQSDSKVANRRPGISVRPIPKAKPYAMYAVIGGLLFVAMIVIIALANSGDPPTNEVEQPKVVASNTTKPGNGKAALVEKTAPKPPVTKVPEPKEVEPQPTKAIVPPKAQNPSSKIEPKPNVTDEKSPFDDDPLPQNPPGSNEKRPDQVAIIEPGITGPPMENPKPEVKPAQVDGVKNDPPKMQVEPKDGKKKGGNARMRNRRQRQNNENKVGEILDVESLDRHPVPKPEDITDRRKKIRANYKEDYARRDNPKIIESLAAKLLELGKESKDDIPAMYAFFDEARMVASSIGDIKSMINATNKLTENFDLNPNKELLATVGMIPNLGDLKPEPLVQLYIYCSDRLVNMLDNDELDFAEPLLKAVVAINSRTVPVYKSRGEGVLKEYLGEINDIKRNLAKIKKACETLDENPDDAAANAEIGRYFFFVRGRQMDAIPYLAKGTESELQKIAAEELTVGADPSAIFALAEKWWQSSSSLEKTNAEARAQIKIHACLLSSNVLNQLKALDKSQAESHLIEIEKDKFVLSSDRSVQKIMLNLLTRGTYRVSWGQTDQNGTMMTFQPNGKMNGDFINWEFSRYWGMVVCWNHFQSGERSVFESRYLTSHSLISVSARGITIRRFNDLGKPERMGTGVLAAK